MCCRAIVLLAAMLATIPTPIDAGERTPQVSAAQRAACMPDARRLCRDAMPNVRRVVICFLGRKAELSNGCRAVLASYGL